MAKQCVICFDDIQKCHAKAHLKCKHNDFHASCILDFIKIGGDKCPLCRTNIDTEYFDYFVKKQKKENHLDSATYHFYMFRLNVIRKFLYLSLSQKVGKIFDYMLYALIFIFIGIITMQAHKIFM